MDLLAMFEQSYQSTKLEETKLEEVVVKTTEDIPTSSPLKSLNSSIDSIKSGDSIDECDKESVAIIKAELDERWAIT